MNKAFRTITLGSAVLAMSLSAIPAQAQFRGLFRDGESGARAAEGCEDDSSGDVVRGVIGGLLGGAARRTANRAGLGSFVPVSRFTSELTKEIACKLDAEEQEQAAEATLEVTSVTDEEGNDIVDEECSVAVPEVGRSASWTSESRNDVSGTSTVTAREASQGGNDCITATDVIIVEGEETRADERMCRLAGSPRYTIVA